MHNKENVLETTIRDTIITDICLCSNIAI